MNITMTYTILILTSHFQLKHWHILQFHSLTISYLNVLQFACMPLKMWLLEQNKLQTWSDWWQPRWGCYLPILNPVLVVLLHKMEFAFGRVIPNCCFILNIWWIKLPGPFNLMCCQAGFFTTIFIFLDIH